MSLLIWFLYSSWVRSHLKTVATSLTNSPPSDLAYFPPTHRLHLLPLSTSSITEKKSSSADIEKRRVLLRFAFVVGRSVWRGAHEPTSTLFQIFVWEAIPERASWKPKTNINQTIILQSEINSNNLDLILALANPHKGPRTVISFNFTSFCPNIGCRSAHNFANLTINLTLRALD